MIFFALKIKSWSDHPHSHMYSVNPFIFSSNSFLFKKFPGWLGLSKKTIKNLLLEYPESEFLKGLDGDKVDGLLLDSEYDIGNEIAKEIYAFTGTKLGQGLAQVATLLSPEAFIFYGGFSNAGHRILGPAKQSMDRHLINNHADDIKLLQSGLPQGQAGILGAASLIWSSLKL